MDKVHTTDTVMTVSSKHSLSVLLSAVEMSHIFVSRIIVVSHGFHDVLYLLD